MPDGGVEPKEEDFTPLTALPLTTGRSPWAGPAEFDAPKRETLPARLVVMEPRRTGLKRPDFGETTSALVRISVVSLSIE